MPTRKEDERRMIGRQEKFEANGARIGHNLMVQTLLELFSSLAIELLLLLFGTIFDVFFFQSYRHFVEKFIHHFLGVATNLLLLL